MATGYEDLLPQQKSSSGDYADLIPTGGTGTIAATGPQETGFERVLRKAGESASSVGPIGLGAAGALKIAARVPQAVRSATGPVARGAERFAQMLVPQTGKQLASATGSAGLAGGSAEFARQQAESAGAGKFGQTLAETAGGFYPSAARVATQKATAPLVEAVGKRLYTPPPEMATPEKAAMQRVLTEADIKLLPSELRESKPLKAVERIFQLLPGSRNEFAEFGRKNQEAVNKAVAQAFGGMQPNLAPAAMQQARNDLTKGYNDLLTNKTFRVDQKVKDELQAAFNQNEELRALAVGKPKVSEFAEALQQNKFDAILWKEVRSDVAAYVSRLEGSSKIIAGKVLKQFDDIAKNNLTKQEHDILMGIDRKYAALSSFQDAFAKNPAIIRAGDVDLSAFAKQYASVEPMNVLYGRTAGRGGDFVPLTEATQTYRTFTTPRVPETQATTLGGLGRAAMGLSLYGGGFGALPVYPALGAGLLSIPPVSRGLARAYLDPQKTAQSLRQAQISPFAAYPMLNTETERK